MSEETKAVNQSDIDAVEAEVAKKQAAEMKKLSEEKAKEIEGKVRGEFEAKDKAKQLDDRLAKIEEENKKLREDSDAKVKEQEIKMKTQEEAFKKQLEEALAVKKGAVTNKSPFNDENENSENIKVVDGREIDVSKLDYDEIEKLSAEEFRRYHGLPGAFFENTGKA